MAVAFATLLFFGEEAHCQEKFETMPRYDRYQKLRNQIYSSIEGGEPAIEWDEDSSGFTFERGSQAIRFDIATMSEAPYNKPKTAKPKSVSPKRPERGRQFETALSPDGKLKAVTRAGNISITNLSGASEVKVTTEGGPANRIKFGIASWVYGEELGVKEAMWWSPDSSKLAFYRFDESEVKDYFLALNQTGFQDLLDREAYPKAGMPNPVVGLFVYDLAKNSTTEVKVRFGDASLAEYVFDVRWSPDGKQLLFNRSNRKQNHLQFCGADPASGDASVIAEEVQPKGWADNHPEVRFLEDKHRFIISTEVNGFKNYVLRDVDGKFLNPITQNAFDAVEIVQVDEKANRILYRANDATMPYRRQLRCASINGDADRLLTDPAFDHNVKLAPDGKHFIDVASNYLTPPESRLVDEDGHVKSVVAVSDTTKFQALGLRKADAFKFKSTDGTVDLYGLMSFPSDFDPQKRYPVLLDVYGGPESDGIPGGFTLPNPATEFGFIVVKIAGRGTKGRGKAFRDAVYKKLGQVEIDDQAAGIKSLASRPYVDLSRVGVSGTSYGGYSTIMCLLRYPDLFKVGCASSSVTDWRNYDSTYTERYMGLPEEHENLTGYDAGSANQFAKNLRGWLMLYYGTADNNVHPSNTLQLVQSIEKSGGRYDMLVGPDAGHTQMPVHRLWSYFIQHLILDQPKREPVALVYERRLRLKRTSKVTP